MPKGKLATSCNYSYNTNNPTESSKTDQTLILVKILREAPESHMTRWEEQTTFGEHHIIASFMEDLINQ